ncbi:DEAD/DEAH box helicase [Alicyclobacillus vulcanalis]|uniref:DEAD/DEAH box helicase domain-containing protein n=1 Tax=Alicyclobacillus vulcanalis TaxID=252246 RepID=A0A1N7NWX7_9BACL|nr:DEAD/DEAH box helicase [Alicyclobacillus vulcanalis]SIT02786.1 DEAD/DEAH box helicase domain-containing protein [Alicyclobacillus vulcanalis]
MNLEQLLDEWRRDAQFLRQVTSWRVVPARIGRYADFPSELHPELCASLAARGIERLYAHQREAWDLIQAGRDVVIATPTASGKTLCYNLPVLQAILRDESARALYVFPTKALAQDQVAELNDLVRHLKTSVRTFTYDGDTPVHARQKIREAGHIVVTNPDMLHAAILPHHTKWLRLFRNLRYVVIDEAHIYRGVFGSHVANVIRRLLRIASFYGARPQMVFCSATIANPGELASRLCGRETAVVSESGAPEGEKHVILYNPPVVNPALGLRQSAITAARRLGSRLLQHEIPTILFARTRNQVEILASYLRRDARELLRPRIVSYRGGYLPNERRAIERGLREGQILGMVSTNALELGVDIGSLEVAITVGYPGSVASTRQQMGRAGRRKGTSAAIFVATSSALDQWMVRHPEALLDASPEAARIYPDNLLILMDHLKCAAYELPFNPGERFGVETTGELLDYLVDMRVLHRAQDGRYYYMADDMPAHAVSLRSAAQENVVIVNHAEHPPVVIGEMDRFSALTMLHEEAIYLHQSQMYQVEKLDLDNGKAFVRPVACDYYTDAELSVHLQVLEENDRAEAGSLCHYTGDVAVHATPTLFKKIKLETHENVGWGKIYLPEAELHTVGYWITFDRSGFPASDDAWEAALKGLGHVLKHAVALHAMCAASDVHVAVEVRDPQYARPSVYVYDAYPGGVGIAERVYRDRDQIFATAFDMVQGCPCEVGCPSCVGPAVEGENLKPWVAELLSSLCAAGAGRA